MLRQLLGSLLALLALCCANAHAGNIVTGATVLHVGNTNNNLDAFRVFVAGGTGPCTSASGVWVVFPVGTDPDIHKRAYAAALLALTTGMHVTLFNYTDDACTGASYIDVYN